MADNIDQFMEEVEQDLKQEKIEKVWKQYGKHFLVGGAVILGGISLFSFWNKHQTSKNQEHMAKLIAAQNFMQQDEAKKAEGVLNLLNKEGSFTYQTLGNFTLAALLKKDAATQGKALDHYKTLSENLKLEEDKRHFATLCKIVLSHSLKKETLDSLTKEIDLIISKDDGWAPLALEIKGMLLLKEKQNKEALEVFTNLVMHKKTSQTMRARARLMTQYLSEQN